MKTKSPAKAFGALLSEKMQSDPDFYLFSPDETTSNKIDAVYDQTARAWGDLAIEKMGYARICYWPHYRTSFGKCTLFLLWSAT